MNSRKTTKAALRAYLYDGHAIDRDSEEIRKMNVLLTSCGLETDVIEQIFQKMLNKEPTQVKAMFIPTAAI